MTDENKIEQMLKAFYNGDTTPEEEVLLLEFFNSKTLDEKWHTDRDILIALYDSSGITLPKGFNERLENAIDNHITQTAVSENEIQNRTLHSKTRRIFIAIASSAAAILICIGIFFFSGSPRSSDMIADTYTNPAEAALAAEQALTFVSAKLNQGLSPLEKVKESMDKTNELLNENFK